MIKPKALSTELAPVVGLQEIWIVVWRDNQLQQRAAKSRVLGKPLSPTSNALSTRWLVGYLMTNVKYSKENMQNEKLYIYI